MKYIQIILRGIGQVMFQNNPYTGLIFLAAIFYNSWMLGLAAIAGTIISTAAARFLKYSEKDISDGLYGFNGTLVGIALIYFLGFNFLSMTALIVFSALSTPLSFYLKKILPPFTAPFVINAWIGIYILVFVFDQNLPVSVPQEEGFNFISAASKSFGQVMFQENTVSGLLLLAGILIHSGISALYSVYAVLLGILCGFLFSVPFSAINAGLMGYNAILCAIALNDKRRYQFLWISAAVVLSVVLTIGFSKSGMLALTAPFVLSSWIILGFKSFQKQKNPESQFQ